MKQKNTFPPYLLPQAGCQYLALLMGFKGRALASVKVTSEESPVPRQGTVGWWGRGGEGGCNSREKMRGNS